VDGAGTINEIFDAQPPYNPRGCFAQAWSVSEVLRLLRTP
jgi:glycogen debranching enzyme